MTMPNFTNFTVKADVGVQVVTPLSSDMGSVNPDSFATLSIGDRTVPLNVEQTELVANAFNDALAAYNSSS